MGVSPFSPLLSMRGKAALHPLHLTAFLVHVHQMKPDSARQQVLEMVARLAARDQCRLPYLLERLP